jgi:hypothetical protein
MASKHERNKLKPEVLTDEMIDIGESLENERGGEGRGGSVCWQHWHQNNRLNIRVKVKADGLLLEEKLGFRLETHFYNFGYYNQFQEIQALNTYKNFPFIDKIENLYKVTHVYYGRM